MENMRMVFVELETALRYTQTGVKSMDYRPESEIVTVEFFRTGELMAIDVKGKTALEAMLAVLWKVAGRNRQ